MSLNLAVERKLDIASLRNFKPIAAFTLHSVLQPMGLHSQQVNPHADCVSNSYGYYLMALTETLVLLGCVESLICYDPAVLSVGIASLVGSDWHLQILI